MLVADREGAEAEAFGRLDATRHQRRDLPVTTLLADLARAWQETLDVNLEPEMIFEPEEEE